MAKDKKYGDPSNRPFGSTTNTKPTFAVCDYRRLDTVHIDQLAQAIWDDINALRDYYNVTYVTNARLIVPATNEWGSPLIIRDPAGKIVTHYDTHHYQPACKDYDL